jgi:hypothetical protein
MLQTNEANEAKQKSLNRKGVPDRNMRGQAPDAKVLISLKRRTKTFLCDLSAFAVDAFDFSGFAL